MLLNHLIVEEEPANVLVGLIKKMLLKKKLIWVSGRISGKLLGIDEFRGEVWVYIGEGGLHGSPFTETFTLEKFNSTVKLTKPDETVPDNFRTVYEYMMKIN